MRNRDGILNKTFIRFLSLRFSFGERKCLWCPNRTGFHELIKKIKTKIVNTLVGVPEAVWPCLTDFEYLHRASGHLEFGDEFVPIQFDFPNFQLGLFPLFYRFAALKLLCLSAGGAEGLCFAVPITLSET